MKDEDMQTFMRETVKVVQYMGNDIMKLQMMVYNLLDDMGKMDRVICPSCNEEVIRPILPNIPLEDVCPSCGEGLFDKNQMSIDDWDNGITREEE
jgi:ribosomal protein S27AE